MNISLFASNTNSKKPIGTITVDDFIAGIKNGKWRGIVEEIRDTESPEHRKNLKLKAPAVTVSGTFSERNQSNLVQHSGFVCIDIDHFNNLPTIGSDPYLYAAFLSVSGRGIAGIIKVRPDKHKESYRWIRNYFFEKYGIVLDPAPSNVASMRTVSYDPDILINKDSLVAQYQDDKPIKVQSLPTVLTQDAISEIISNIVNRGIDLAPTYDQYVQLAFALADGFGEGGRHYFHALCQVSEKYDSRHCDYQYSVCLKRPKGKVTVGTFYHMVKSAGVELPSRQQEAVHTVAIAKKSGRTKEDTVQQLVQTRGLSEHQAKELTDQVYKREDITLKTLASDPERLIESVIEWMKLNHAMKRNLITGKIIEAGTGKEISKERINTIYLRCRAQFNNPSVTHDLIERVIFSEFTTDYHPIHSFYKKNASRQPKGICDKLIGTITTSTPYAPLVIRKWLISLHAAVDGYPVRSVLVLVGKQQEGKTEFLRRLLPQELQPYYAESKLDRGKDDELLMCQNLIVMDDEMGGKSKQDEKRLKELTSKNYFTLRAPYDRANQQYKRLAVLCGTSNEMEVINDPTGNTRILPINFLSYNMKEFNEIDKTDLFMETYHAYKAGEEWNITKDEFRDLIDNETEIYKAVAFEQEILCQLFRPVSAQEYGEFMTATEIKNYIEMNTKHQIKAMNRLGNALRSIFGHPRAVRMNNIPVKAYQVVKVPQDQLAKFRMDPESSFNRVAPHTENSFFETQLSMASATQTPF